MRLSDLWMFSVLIFSGTCDESVEISYIKNICEKTGWSPFSVRTPNKSQLVYVKGFYNIGNAINVKELQLGTVEVHYMIF